MLCCLRRNKYQGAYCSNECGQKLIGYVTPTTCKCYHRYCEACWRQQFRDALRFSKAADVQYYTKRGTTTYDEVEADLWEARAAYRPQCPECGNLLDEEKCDRDG